MSRNNLVQFSLVPKLSESCTHWAIKFLYLAREQKTAEYEADGDTNGNNCTWNNP